MEDKTPAQRFIDGLITPSYSRALEKLYMDTIVYGTGRIIVTYDLEKGITAESISPYDLDEGEKL